MPGYVLILVQERISELNGAKADKTYFSTADIFRQRYSEGKYSSLKNKIKHTVIPNEIMTYNKSDENDYQKIRMCERMCYQKNK